VTAWIAVGLFETGRVAQEAAVFEGWHEFYLLAGTAAATLVGLLFVSLSFNLEVLLHETKSHLLAHARESMLSFMYILILSFMFLIPRQSSRFLGWGIVIASLIILAVLTVGIARTRRAGGYSEHERFLHKRRRLTVIGHLAAIFVGVSMALRQDPYQTYWMIGIVCMLIGNAAGSAWDLLVQVGRIRAAMETARRPG